MDFGPIPAFVRAQKKERKIEHAGMAYIHVACGTPVRVMTSHSPLASLSGGYCPKCKHFYPLPED